MAKAPTPLPNPLPQAGEGTNEKSNIQLSVAYHDGPGEIGFAGRHWQRGVAQPVAAEEWAAMQARADFNEFDFIEEK
jgi:hypothetical protein